MFERFTDRARRSLVLAQEEARGLGHNFIGTEHILLGLLAEGSGVAFIALRSLGFTVEGIREAVAAAIGSSGEPVSEKPPFTPRAKKVLEASLREALKLGHNYIGTEHMLLGIVQEGEGVAAQVLVGQGHALDEVRHAVISTLGHADPTRLGPPSRPFAARPPVPSVLAALADLSPAAAGVLPAARRLARADATGGASSIGTHHILRALFDLSNGAAARALTSLGVTAATLAQAIAAIDVTQTADAPPQPPGSTAPLEFDLGHGVVVRIGDRAMAERILLGEGDPSSIARQLKDALGLPLDEPPAEPPTEGAAE
jgi:ATP-dependent Clp protease ATP-binding subunit ClpC